MASSAPPHRARNERVSRRTIQAPAASLSSVFAAWRWRYARSAHRLPRMSPPGASAAKAMMPAFSRVLRSTAPLWRDNVNGGLAEIGRDEIGAAFADHDRGRVGVARDQLGHDRGVGNIEALDAAHPQFGIAHREIVRPHPRGTDGMIDRVGPGTDQAFERGVVIAVDRITIAA